jgi:hypothetical protein
MVSKNEKTYETTLKLAYDDGERRWKAGDFSVSIVMAPVLTINGSRNVNALTITVVNRNNNPSHNNFAMSFDSVGDATDGKPILYAKFEDAYSQLEKNKANLEKFLNANLDISILNDQKPMILEFERRAAGESLGNSELVFD